MRLRIFGVVVVFAAGLALGALGSGLMDPARLSIDSGTRETLVLAVGAIVTALLVLLAASVAGLTVAKAFRDAASIEARTARVQAEAARSEAEAARADARRQALIERQRSLRSLIIAKAARHTREVQTHVVRRQELAGRPYQPLPEVRQTMEIEDAVAELYTLGFQKTADVAQALSNVLRSLDTYCLVATPEITSGQIAGLSPEQMLDCVAWSEVEAQVQADLMQVGLTDEGVGELKPGGTLEQDYLGIWFKQARERRVTRQPSPQPPKRAATPGP